MHYDGEPGLAPCTRIVRTNGLWECESGPRPICYTAATFIMIDPKKFEQVFDTLRQTIPGGLAQGVEKNLRAALTAALAKLDLVTREELEIQAAVLTRTREKIEALEKLVAELEQTLRK